MPDDQVVGEWPELAGTMGGDDVHQNVLSLEIDRSSLTLRGEKEKDL